MYPTFVHHPLSLGPYYFIPGVGRPFLQILGTVAFFIFRTDSVDSPDCLLILLNISVFFYFFCTF